MTVMAARVHDALVPGCVLKACCLANGERIHICPQPDAAIVATLSVDNSDHAGATDPSLYLVDTKGSKLISDNCGSPVLLKSQFRV